MKVNKTSFYEFDLDDKKCIVDVELFKKILCISLRVPNEDFIVPPSEESMITFLYELGYKDQIKKLASMFVDHMHQPWRTLAAIINKCLSGKTSSNDRLRKSRMDILWGEDFQEYRRAIPYTMLTDDIKKLEAYQAFIGYSTGLIPPKKSRDVDFELGKSISRTKAEIADEARRVHETHERLVIEKRRSKEDSDE
ncbi:hypothetical protein Tco_0941414 [Tanacetum coccineum]|uniref:Uncharacterized protein n=1 Tax=Tanacetum coccineum TaxID=301880 RepID=A0ABQ5DWS2_9ASTR